MTAKLIVGNWKMNGNRQSATELADGITKALEEQPSANTVAVCPPALYLPLLAELLAESPIRLGAQTCHGKSAGAHTGDLAAAMLAEFGIGYVIVGHSERRADHHEADATVRAQADAALAAGLTPIICVGETEAERDAGQAEEIVSMQIRRSVPTGIGAEHLVIAYEPVWAIGTGRTAESADILAMHRTMRLVVGELCADAERVPLLYGGSVKPANAAEILTLDHVDGALVGGASLKVADFMAIVRAA